MQKIQKKDLQKKKILQYNKKEDVFGPKYIEVDISNQEVFGGLKQLNKPKTKEEYITYKK